MTKPKKTVRKERPFREYDPDAIWPPGPDNPPQCGAGKSKQIDIHTTLFDVATRSTGLYDKDLADLTRKLNAVFRAEGPAALRRKQKEWDDKSLELTVALHDGALYLTYARPVHRRRGR
jgi:hypothetical protein